MASWRAGLGLGGALATAVAALGVATEGFRAWTTDDARALAVARHPPVVPAVPLVGADAAPVLLADPTRATIVDFVYTDCPTVCLELAAGYGRLQRAIAERGLGDRVRLLSVSFDPARDTPARLAEFARMHGADPALWQVAVPVDPADLPALLRVFGVRVIADGAGGWMHNAALHVVDASGRLRAILPPEAADEALRVAAAAGPPPGRTPVSSRPWRAAGT